MYYRIGCWVIALFLASAGATAQSENNHIAWRFSSLKQSGSESKLVFTATIDRGWHLYSQKTPAGGPMPVSFRFEKNEAFKVIGGVKELGALQKGYDDVFMTDVLWYEGSVVFSQMVKVKGRTTGTVRGEIEYSVCSEEMCVPGSIRFSIEVGN